MFFIASKVVWFVAAPSNLLFLALLASGARTARRGPAGRLALLAVIVTGALAYTLLGALPLRIAEARFEAPETLPAAPTGVIVLGGAVRHLKGWPRPRLNEAADRLLAMAELGRAYPDAPIVFTGGEGSLRHAGRAEADVVRDLASSLGLDLTRVIFENRSRNTHENAVRTRALLEEAGLPLDGWLLVTSAFHMPRAVGVFRRQGFDVTPYPVDYRSGGAPTLAAGLARLDLGLREALGLLAYRLTGRSGTLFPAPDG